MRQSKRFGFTMVELSFVLVVIGLLAIISLHGLHGIKEKAVRAKTKTILKNLMTTQEAYWTVQDGYSPNTSSLTFETNPGFTVTILSAELNGWSGEVDADGYTIRCYVYYGTTPPVPPATKSNEIACL